jgi:two-component system sensor histidine kinase PilS (NtrC family)
VFQTLSAWFTQLENFDFKKIREPDRLVNNIVRMRKMFSLLSVITGLFVLGTAFYLAYQFKKSRVKPSFGTVPPLHDYLLELKGSESQLKNLVEKQQVHVAEKEELNKSIINNINAAVIFLNQSGRIDIFNNAAQLFFSQSFVNAKNNLLTEVLRQFPEILDFLTSSEESKLSGEVCCGDKVFQVDLNPIENIGELIIIRDITEEKRREEFDRRNSNFIMLGEMAAFLAHEVRNSLGVIYGYTKTIKAEKEKSKTGKIDKEINFLTEMMESFLNFSKPVKPDKIEKLDLAALFKTVARETGIKLVQEQGEGEKPGKIILQTDPTLMRSIVSNLLLNAKEAGADRVDIKFDQHPDGKLEVFLKDNGKGIDDEIKEKIWFPFFTTKEKGTGMGLAMIRKIITSLEGEIVLVDTGKQGSRFQITFYD